MISLEELKDFFDRCHVSSREKKLILSYFARVKRNDIVHGSNFDNDTFIVDLKILNEYLTNSKKTPIVEQRFREEKNLINIYTMYLNTKDQIYLDEASYGLDLLYEEVELPVRKNNVIQKVIKMKQRGK